MAAEVVEDMAAVAAVNEIERRHGSSPRRIPPFFLLDLLF
jgi:hypothetical protein